MGAADDIRGIVERVVRIVPPTHGDISRALGVPVQHIESVDDMDYYGGALPAGPLDAIDLRINHTTKLGILVLRGRESAPFLRRDLKTDGYGPPAAQVNPYIPPDGTASYIYTLNGLEVTFQFAAKTDVLRTLSVKWPERAKKETRP